MKMNNNRLEIKNPISIWHLNFTLLWYNDIENIILSKKVKWNNNIYTPYSIHYFSKVFDMTIQNTIQNKNVKYYLKFILCKLSALILFSIKYIFCWRLYVIYKKKKKMKLKWRIKKISPPTCPRRCFMFILYKIFLCAL